ncbi:hypothetical protein GCM10029992_20930 [Glycomyces albus]
MPFDGVDAFRAGHGLVDLAADQSRERQRLAADGLGAEFGHDLGGLAEQVVAGEDGDGVVPAGVGAGRAAPDGGLVHDVVVVEGGQVGQFEGHGRFEDAGPVRVAQVGAREGEHRPEPLASGVDQVRSGLAQQRLVGVDGLEQSLFDGLERFADAVGEGVVGKSQGGLRASGGHHRVTLSCGGPIPHGAGSGSSAAPIGPARARSGPR